MLLILAVLTLSVDLHCDSPLITADPVDDAELLYIAVLARHGKRTPIKTLLKGSESDMWNCDRVDAQSPKNSISRYNNYSRRIQRVVYGAPFPNNCELGELTIEGMDQHLELGRFYREWLVDKMQFLPEWFTSDLVKVRSSYTDRCQRSAVSFMNGFFPPDAPGHTIRYNTGSERKEWLQPNPYMCDDVKDLYDKFVSSEVYKQRVLESDKIYANLYKELNITSSNTTWIHLADWIYSYMCVIGSVPKISPTEEQLQRVVDDIGFYSYQYYKTDKKVAASPIWRHILKDIDNFLNNKEGKFQLYTAHDATITALLASLDYDESFNPPFRSHMSIELWKSRNDVCIRFVFNGKAINSTLFNSSELIPLKNFKKTLKEGGYLDHCLKEYPDE